MIAFDTRGMGESDKPPGPYDFDVLADDLDFVLAELGAADVTLVGWSMGVSIGLEYMRRHGDRAGRLALINGPIVLRATEDFPWGVQPDQLDGYFETLAAGWPAAEREFAGEALRDPDGPLGDFYYQVALQTPLEMAMRIVRAQAELDHRALIGELEIPVLAIYGAHDPYYPTDLAHWIADQARDGRAVIFEESAHGVHFDELDLFVETIDNFAKEN